MEDEEPEGPLLLPSGATPLGDQPGDMAVTELSALAVPARTKSRPFGEAAAAVAPRSDSLMSTPPELSGGAPPDSVVGGRLQRHADFWYRWCQKGSSVLDIVRYGARLEFEKSPLTTTTPSPVQTPTDPTRARALCTEVQALLDKGTVSVVEDHSSPGFYSHVFLVPKKLGEWRLIIDLSRLYRFLRVPRFKMETTRSVATAIWIFGMRISTSRCIRI
jgi:hypothetical protein